MSTKIMQSIDLIKKKLEEADAIVVGAGSGLTSAAGIDYMNEEFFASKYSMFLKKGYRTIWEGVTSHWQVSKENATSYWGFWSRHIQNVFYEPSQLATYKKLYELINNKEHFVITTNADGQFYKGNFNKEKIFSMQGNYAYFQCQKKCHQKVYDNQIMVTKMLEGFNPDTLEIRQEDIPYCPVCGELLCPNLRIDNNFVENKEMDHHKEYIDFINKNANKKIVFLELGIGFNTPSIIRYPFEEMTKVIKEATLIRVNKEDGQIRSSIEEKVIVVKMNIDELILHLVS